MEGGRRAGGGQSVGCHCPEATGSDPVTGGWELGLAKSIGTGPPSAPPTDLPQQLGYDLDLLATGEQVAKGHAGDTCHLHGVHQHHEPLQ